MKKTVFVIALCCIVFPTWSQFFNKRSELGLKGTVSIVVEREFQLINYDYKNRKEQRRATFIFNPEGMKTEEKYTTPSGEVLYFGVFKYSPTGELIEETVNNAEYKKSFVKKYVITPENITVNIEIGYEAPSVLERYTLDAKKRVTQKNEYDNGKLVRTFNYVYNSLGQLQSETQQMPGLNINFRYSYDDKGQLTKKSEVNASGATVHTLSYIYDKYGNIETETTSYADDPHKLTLKYKYVLDYAGNWTVKQEFMDGRLFSMTTREISYF
jgi:hypothetical protein